MNRHLLPSSLALVALAWAVLVGVSLLPIPVTENAVRGQLFVNCQPFGSGGFGYHASVRPSTCVFQGLPPSGSKEWKLSSLGGAGGAQRLAGGAGLSPTP